MVPLPRLVAAFAICLLATPIAAQSSLGVSGATFDIGAVDGDAFVATRIDTAITGHHGLQFDAVLSDHDAGLIGQMDGHLYMRPAKGQEYGLFAQVGDADGRSRSWGAAGIEGMFAAGANTAVELRGGLALSQPGGWDALFADAGVIHGLSDSLSLTARLTLTEIDELVLSTIARETRLGVEFHPRGTAWGAFADITADRADGSETTTLRLGLSLTLGDAGGTAPETRLFRAADPFGPLFRRGRL